MNKKIVAIFIFIVVTIILLLLSYPNNVVTIELQRESISDTGATIIITDKGFQKHGWGAEYFLHAKENGEWKRLEPLSYIPNPDSIFPLFDFKFFRIKIDLFISFGIKTYFYNSICSIL